MQSKLECKNCQGYATKVIQNDSIMDVESDIQNISLSNQNSQDDVSSEASTDSETSMIMDELINNDTRVIRDNTNENFDPKQMALDFFSRLSN
jgi:tyrosine-protein phosphatase YwqE